MSDYRRLSIAGKQAHHRASMREPSVVCPTCETQTTAADLIAHIDSRCEGRREPAPHSRWISWGEARRLGVPGWTLTRWVQSGEVRFLGGRQDRRYLMRDIALRMANKRASRRR